MIRTAHDRQILQIRMTGGTLLIGPTQHPNISFWQKALRQDQLHPLAGHGLRQAAQICHAGPELRLLLDRLGVSTRNMTDTEAEHTVQRAIHDKRLSAAFIPAVKPKPATSSELAGKLTPAPVPPIAKPQLFASLAQRSRPGAAALPVSKKPAFDVARATPPERMVEMLRRTPKHLEGQLKQAVDRMLSSGSVALLGASLAALATAHIVGAGEAVDAFLAGLAFLAAGWSGLVALKNIVVAVVKAATATHDAELEEAAEQFASGIEVLGETFLTFLLAKAAPKGGGGAGKIEEVPKPNLVRQSQRVSVRDQSSSPQLLLPEPRPSQYPFAHEPSMPTGAKQDIAFNARRSNGVDMEKLSNTDSAAAMAMNRGGWDLKKQEEILNSGRDFSTRKGEKGEMMYKFGSSSFDESKASPSAYFLDEKGFANIKSKYFDESSNIWDNNGIKNELALPCYNSADTIWQGTLSEDQELMMSGINPASETVVFINSDGSIASTWQRGMSGGGNQITPTNGGVTGLKMYNATGAP